MSYVTVDEVASLFRNLDLTVSNPAVTTAEIEQFIAEADNVIDAKIGLLYTLPITEIDNPVSFSILKTLSKFKVACMVDDILNDYSEADKKPTWCKKAHELMLELVPPIDKKTCKQCEPTMKLPDAPYTGTITEQGRRMSLKSTSDTIFKKGVDTW